MKSVALIVTFNRLEKLKLCWAVTAQQSFDYVVIVNNASSDGTQEWLNGLNDRRLHLLHCEENLGGAGGFKKGASYIADNISADWVFIYDDDAWPQDNIIETFSNLNQHSDYDAFACKVVNTRNELCKMNLPWVRFPKTFRENVDYRQSSQEYVVNPERCENVITFSFVGVIIRYKTLVNNLSSIYEGLFIYFDDVYFSAHLSAAGHKIQYTPEIYFVHDVPDTTSNDMAAWKVYYLIRNMLLDKKLMGENAPFTFAFKAARVAKYAMLTLKQTRKVNYIRYFMKGIADGICGRTGRRH